MKERPIYVVRFVRDTDVEAELNRWDYEGYDLGRVEHLGSWSTTDKDGDVLDSGERFMLIFRRRSA